MPFSNVKKEHYQEQDGINSGQNSGSDNVTSPPPINPYRRPSFANKCRTFPNLANLDITSAQKCAIIEAGSGPTLKLNSSNNTLNNNNYITPRDRSDLNHPSGLNLNASLMAMLMIGGSPRKSSASCHVTILNLNP